MAIASPEIPPGRKLSVISIVGWVAALSSVVSLPLALYCYVETIIDPDLTYSIHPIRTIIVRAGQASKLYASCEDAPITTDVSSARLAIWNEGKLPIKPSQVLAPITFVTSGGTRIIEARVIKTSRPVTNVRLDETQSSNGRLGIAWDILEKGDGVIVQIIYAGDTRLRLTVDGVIEGQEAIQELAFAGTIKTPDEQYEYLLSAKRRLSFSFFAVALVLLLLTFARTSFSIRAGRGASMDWWLIAIALCAMGFGTWQFMESRQFGPPFGF